LKLKFAPNLDRMKVNEFESMENAMAKTVTLRLDEETYRIFSEAAKAERRSIANLIGTSALHKIIEQQFVDEAEHTEILSNDKLLGRMKKGSRDAQARRGGFVE